MRLKHEGRLSLILFLGFVALLAVCLYGCANRGERDYLQETCRAVEVAVLTAEDYESAHPGEIDRLSQRIEEARAILDLFCSGGEITIAQLDDLRAMGPILRTILERSGRTQQQIDATMLGLSVVLNAVEVYYATERTP